MPPLLFYLDPLFNELNAIGYCDELDPALQRRAATWYAMDWAVWGGGSGRRLRSLARALARGEHAIGTDCLNATIMDRMLPNKVTK